VRALPLIVVGLLGGACVGEAGPAPCTEDERCLVGYECYLGTCAKCDQGSCGGLVMKAIPVTGGRLCGPDEACIEIPPGALTASVTIGIRRSRQVVPDLDVRSLVYDIEPVDLRFAIPATVQIPISPSNRLDDMRVFVAPGTSTNFGPLPGTPTPTYAIGAAERLGTFVGARLPARD
jgi:hypothetical protein